MSKYHSKPAYYKDQRYDSKLEADYAQQLDWLIMAGQLKSWERQFKIEIRVNGEHICFYFIDFKVIYPDGRVEYHEVKGMATDLWRLKWRLVKALYPDWKFILIRKGGLS